MRSARALISYQHNTPGVRLSSSPHASALYEPQPIGFFDRVADCAIIRSPRIGEYRGGSRLVHGRGSAVGRRRSGRRAPAPMGWMGRRRRRGMPLFCHVVAGRRRRWSRRCVRSLGCVACAVGVLGRHGRAGRHCRRVRGHRRSTRRRDSVPRGTSRIQTRTDLASPGHT